MIRIGIGQDSHRFEEQKTDKELVLGGVVFPRELALQGNSDADVVLHAITNGISGITGKPILGKVADTLCKQGVTDSAVYLEKAVEDLTAIGYKVGHVSISLECLKPKIMPKLEEIRTSVAELLGITTDDVGLTATTGEGLTDFGKGLGVQAFCVVTGYKV
jgi:2-C-methyl-D-erythritol 2,4-cyclodiphosphate synthase